MKFFKFTTVNDSVFYDCMMPFLWTTRTLSLNLEIQPYGQSLRTYLMVVGEDTRYTWCHNICYSGSEYIIKELPIHIILLRQMNPQSVYPETVEGKGWERKCHYGSVMVLAWIRMALPWVPTPGKTKNSQLWIGRRKELILAPTEISCTDLLHMAHLQCCVQCLQRN